MSIESVSIAQEFEKEKDLDGYNRIRTQRKLTVNKPRGKENSTERSELNAREIGIRMGREKKKGKLRECDNGIGVSNLMENEGDRKNNDKKEYDKAGLHML